MTEKLKQEVNPLSEVVQQVAQICPAAVQDGKIDFERLRTEWSADLNEPDVESYNFTWVGKNAAIAEANKKIRKTLRPVKADSKNWENTQNLYIEGDNLDVLKLLQESYLGKVKMIYIDPPYNTGNDFVYCDDFTLGCAEYIEKKGQCDIETNERLFRNTETNGRFHSDWCSMIYPRLKIARDLLSDDGVIFISIDDNEQANLKKICDEVFGENNFVAQFVWTNNEGGGGSDSKFFKVKHEYVLSYAKNINFFSTNNVSIEDIDRYKLSDEFEQERGKYQLVKLASASIQYSSTLDYPIKMPDGTDLYPVQNTDKNKACWRWSKSKLDWGITNGFVVFKKDRSGVWQVYTKQYVNCDKDGNIVLRTKTPLALIDKFSSTQASNKLIELMQHKCFSYPKPVSLIQWFVDRIPDKSFAVLDFFSGSGTTAHAVMQLNAEDGGNRKFIMVQLPEATDEKSEAYKAGYKNICEIGKERIRRAGDKIMSEHPDAKIDTGFRVFRLDDTNMKDVYYKPVDTAQDSLLDMVDNIKPDRTDMDLLFGAMLERGLMLDMPVEEVQSNGITYYVVNNGDLIACFAKNIPESVIHEIANRRPLQALFRDSSFAESKDKINLTEIFKNVDSNIKVCVL